MNENEQERLDAHHGPGDRTRRQFLSAALAGSVAMVVGAVDGHAQPGARPTPACGDSGGLTLEQTEGPYFKASSPQRTTLVEPGMSGTRIVVEGRVLAADCRPIRRVLIDAWQADDRGRYDNAGYRLRGHQFTDDAGRYRLETVVPGLYPGRTRHIHVKVQAPGQPALTTQLYFPGESENQRDFIWSPLLVMKVRDVDGKKLGTFDFVLDVRGSGA